MSYYEEIQEKQKEIRVIKRMPLSKVLEEYGCNTEEEIINIIEDEIKELKSKQMNLDIEEYVPERYYHYLEV